MMERANWPYHSAAVAPIVGYIVVGVLSFRVWRTKSIAGFFFLAIACGMFLVESVYGYMGGLSEYGIIQWPLGAVGTYRAYLITSYLSVVAQLVFVTGIVLIAKAIRR